MDTPDLSALVTCFPSDLLGRAMRALKGRDLPEYERLFDLLVQAGKNEMADAALDLIEAYGPDAGGEDQVSEIWAALTFEDNAVDPLLGDLADDAGFMTTPPTLESPRFAATVN